jgi:hypothetical protein
LIVLLAVQRGIVSLDEPIATYLPGFTLQSSWERSPEKLITLRHLLSHTSGLTHEAPVGSNRVVGPASFRAHCRSISETWLRFPVGHHFEYSNLGFDLAAHILGEVTGQAFARLPRRWLFDPLGLSRTTFDQREIAGERDRAIGHAPGVRREPVRMPMVGAGGLYTSVLDACRWVQLHLRKGEGLLSANLLDEMYRQPGFGPRSYRAWYGLGVLTARMDGLTVRGHSGGGFGFLADAYWHPETEIGVVVLTNDEEHPLQWDLARRVLVTVVGDAANGGTRPARAWKAAPEGPVAARACAGTYVGRGGRVTIAVDGLNLSMDDGSRRLPVRVVQRDGKVDPSDRSAAWLRFMQDETGLNRYLQDAASGAVWYRNEQSTTPGTTERWGSIVGEYWVPVHGGRRASAGIRSIDGHLLLDWPESPGLFLEERAPGVLFTCLGEALDLRRDPPIYAGVPMRRRARGVVLMTGGR